MNSEAQYVNDISVHDPDLDEKVTLELWRDPFTGALIALDAEFVDGESRMSGSVEIVSPYNQNRSLILRSI